MSKFFLIILSIFFIQTLYSQEDTKATSSLGTEIQEFVQDFIKCLDHSFESREYTISQNRVLSLQSLFISRDQLQDGKELMEHWVKSTNPSFSKLSKQAVNGFNKMILAISLFVEIVRENSTNPQTDIALARANWQGGRDKLLDVTRELIQFMNTNQRYISNEQLQVINYTLDRIFGDDFEKYGDSKEKKPLEVVAALILKDALSQLMSQ